MEKHAKIYVAGHRGLVGSAIVRRLKAEGFDNIITRSHAELDLTDQAQVNNFFAREKPEYVFLAAAKVGGIMANKTYPAEFIYKNLMIGCNVVEACYQNGVKKLLNLGSSCIYPRLAPQPMKEDALLTSELEPTNEAYAIAKIAAIKLCRYYNQQYGTNFISVMPTNQYGAGDNFNMETAHLLPMLMRRFHLAKLLQYNDFDAIIKDIKKYKLGWGLDEKINFEDEASIISALAQIGAYISLLEREGVVWRVSGGIGYVEAANGNFLREGAYHERAYARVYAGALCYLAQRVVGYVAHRKIDYYCEQYYQHDAQLYQRPYAAAPARFAFKVFFHD